MEPQKLPAGHDKHAVKPVDGVYVPAAQSVELAKPAIGQKSPAGQAVQTPLRLKVPAVQLNSVEVPVELQFEPGGHGRQTDAPVVGL